VAPWIAILRTLVLRVNKMQKNQHLYMDKEGLCWTRPYLVPSIGPGPDTEKATAIGAVQGEIGPLKVIISILHRRYLLDWSSAISQATRSDGRIGIRRS
jgi:hypothetical protein